MGCELVWRRNQGGIKSALEGTGATNLKRRVDAMVSKVRAGGQAASRLVEM